MASSDSLAATPFNNSSVTKMKDRTPFDQLVTRKAHSMQRIVQVAHRVAQKSCRRACELFCCPLGTLLPEKAPCCPAQNHQAAEEKTTQAVTLRTLPSTILIVNISNSTLIDCVIGNGTYLPSAVAESQPLMQRSNPQMHDQARCSCSRGQQGAAQTCATPPPPPHHPLHPLCPPPPSAESPSISIHGSHLNCVIIGDNNYMRADQTHSTETEEPQA